MFDTGTSTGEIIGHSKRLNAVSIRRKRPVKAATASDDATIGFHNGTENPLLDAGLRSEDQQCRCAIQVRFSEPRSNSRSL